VSSSLAGLPIVAIPQGADQFINSPWWARSGAVKVIQPAELDANSIAASISATLDDSTMRAAAVSMATSIAAMPSPLETADKLIDLGGLETS
jgi:UDP:flavonoid glycosyltransferase YjiC (YdhE family)